MAYYTAFITQWATLTPGTTAAKLIQINAQTVAQSPRPITLVSGSQIYNVIVPAEFQALSATNQQLVRDILSLGSAIDASIGTNVRNTLLQVFTAVTGPGTRTAFHFTTLGSIFISGGQ